MTKAILCQNLHLDTLRRGALHGSSRKALTLTGLALLGVLPLASAAATLTIKPDMAGKWNAASSYVENELPSTGDIVQIAKQTSVQAVANDIAFLESAGVAEIVYEMEGAEPYPVLTVDVAEGSSVSFSGRIVNSKTLGPTAYFSSGTLVKRGLGRLNLTCGKDIDCYRSSFCVDEGVLKFPESVARMQSRKYLKITVNNPGILILTTASEDYNTASTYCCGGLWGDGTVSNDSPRRAYLRCASNADDPFPTFAGKICGKIRVNMNGAYHQAFTRPQNSAVNVPPLIESTADLRLLSIGGRRGGLSNEGSLGAQYFEVGESPTVTYLGTGETSYAEFRGNDDQKRLVLSGGSAGGFDHRGLVNFSSAANVATEFVLAGDFPAENPCTAGSIVSNVFGSVRTTRLVKRGTGTWNLVENPESCLNGVVAVEDGTLTFDSLASAGVRCALGWATTCQEDYDATSFDPVKTVDYAVLLGTSSTTGTLAYVGADATPPSARKVALAGEGRISSETAALNWSGVTSADSGTHTIRLGGSADGSVVRDISDGPGKVRVVKEGSGSLTLGGVLDFSGGLEVRGGTLAISAATSMNYSWYRIFLKERRGGEVDEVKKNYFHLSRFGLFDADGNWINTNLVMNAAANGAAWRLRPGETALSFADPDFDVACVKDTNGSCGSLFLGATGSAFWGFYNANEIPSLSKTNAWVGVAFRMPSGSAAVTSYDLGTRWAPNDANARYNNHPQSWTVQGSFDGVNWTDLSSVVSNTVWAGAAYYWIRQNRAFDPARTNTSGWPIAAGEDLPTSIFTRGLDDVAVAVGSALCSETAVSVRKVTVDVAAGMGTMTGFALAEGGVIDLTNAPAKGSFDVTVDLTGVTLPATFSFTVNGAVDRRKVTLSADRRKIQVLANGFLLIFR